MAERVKGYGLGGTVFITSRHYGDGGHFARPHRERRNERFGFCRHCYRHLVPLGNDCCPICHRPMELIHDTKRQAEDDGEEEIDGGAG